MSAPEELLAGADARPAAAARAAARVRPLLVPAGFLVATGALLFPASGRDDSYLTYWPAWALASLGEIVNLNGERVEQSSSLLEVLLLAAAAKGVPLPLPTLGLLLSVLAGAACAMLAAAVARRSGPDPRAAAWLVATATPLVYWSFSGLETSLAALLSLALVASAAAHLEGRRTLPAPPVWGAMLAFLAVRPEAILVLACVLAGALVLSLRGPGLGSRRQLLGLAGAAALCFLPLAVFRLVWFGSLFPQPVAAKSFTHIATGAFVWRVLGGADYLVAQAGTIFLAAFWLGIGAAALSLLRAWRGEPVRPFEGLGALFCGAYLGFVLTTGGDYMEGARYVVPFLPVALLLACGAIHRSLPRHARPLLAVLVGLQLVGTLVFARHESTGIPLGHWLAERFPYSEERFSWTESANRVHRRDLALAERLPTLVAAIGAHTGRTVTVLSKQMGMVPYHLATRLGPRTGEAVRFIDAYGLATRDVTRDAFLPLLPQWRRDRIGTLFEEPERIEAAWGVARPDVIYDLGDPPDVLAESGYTVVFRQVGEVEGPSRLLPGAPVRAGCWVAVRDDLLPALPTAQARGPGA